MAVKVKCVHCGTMVDEFVTECPKCGRPVANKWAPTKVSDAPWKWTKDKKTMSPLVPIAAIVAVIAAAGIVYFVLMK